ncbi:MAG: HAD-IA family hydrolase [Chloroflexota bacterium]
MDNLQKQMPFAALIFDHDGTLIDTETQDFRSCQVVFAEQGVTLTAEKWAETVVGRFGGYDLIFDELVAEKGGDLTRDYLWTRLRASWRKNFDDSTLMPYVAELIPNLKSAGYRLAVATASDAQWANRWLTQFALIDYFEVIATKDNVTNNKPAPDVYLYAAEQLAVQPEKCLVFEDSLAGVQAAKAAGMTVVAVPSPLTRSLDFSIADHVIDGLSPVRLSWLEKIAGIV